MPFDPTIRQVIASFRSSPKWDEELDLRLMKALWPKIVGPALAASTTPVGLDGPRIVIRVPDPSWKRHLLSTKGRLLAKINEPWPNPWITEIGFFYEDKRY